MIDSQVRSQIIDAMTLLAKANIAKHRTNVDILLDRNVGVAEHGDLIETVQKELDMIAKYEDQLSALEKYFYE